MQSEYIGDVPKVKSIIHYICEKYNHNGGLGAVKLNKILWFLDKFWFLEHHESATTISHYWRQPRGPMIPNFYDITRELEAEEIIKISTIGPNSFKQTKYNCDVKNNISDYISDKQLELLDEIADVMVNKLSGNAVSELSHQNCWNSFADGSYIPLETVLWDDITPPSEKMMEWINSDSQRAVA